MKKNRILTILGVIGLISALVALPFMAACAKPAPAPAPAPVKIVLKGVQMQSKGHMLFIGWEEFVKRIEEKSKGELVIDVIGGPEVMPTAEQGKALQRRIFDIGSLYGGWIGEVIPPLYLSNLTPLTIAEQREAGFYDLVQEEAQKAGLYFLGPWRLFPKGVGHFHVSINQKIERPQELAGLGLTIATFAGMKPWMEALGMNVALMPPGERYTAVERGVAQGACFSVEGHASFSFWEVVPYWIDHGVENINHFIILNLDTWNRLPGHLQKLLIDTRMEMEAELEAITVKAQADAKVLLIAGGMEPITFSEADVEWYHGLNFDARWKEAFELYPEIAPIVKQMLWR